MRSVIVNKTSTEARLAPGIVYSVHCSTNSWYFVYSVFSVTQHGSNWAKRSVCTTLLIWHSIIMDKDLRQFYCVQWRTNSWQVRPFYYDNSATFFTDSWFCLTIGKLTLCKIQFIFLSKNTWLPLILLHLAGHNNWGYTIYIINIIKETEKQSRKIKNSKRDIHDK